MAKVDCPEGGARCFKCYRLRLEQTKNMAKKSSLIILQQHFQLVL